MDGNEQAMINHQEGQIAMSDEKEKLEMQKAVRDCIDMDEWKHSWHKSLDKWDDLVSCKIVIQEKIEERIDDLAKLKDGLHAAIRLKEIF